MRDRQVLDVDVVADRGAVGRRIVGPVDLDRGRGAERGAQDVRDQVRLGVVVLAEAAARAGDVEVPEADRAQPGGRAEVTDHQVDGELRGAVRVDGLGTAVSAIGTSSGSP